MTENLSLLSKALWRDERGTSVVELAFIAPLIMFASLAAVDYAQGFAAKVDLQQAAGRALEKAIAFDNPSTDSALIIAEASAASGQPTGNVTVTKWLECDGTLQGSFTGVCANGAQIGRYISVRITRSYTPRFNYGRLFRAFGGGQAAGSTTISGSNFVRVQ